MPSKTVTRLCSFAHSHDQSNLCGGKDDHFKPPYCLGRAPSPKPLHKPPTGSCYLPLHVNTDKTRHPRSFQNICVTHRCRCFFFRSKLAARNKTRMRILGICSGIIHLIEPTLSNLPIFLFIQSLRIHKSYPAILIGLIIVLFVYAR